MKTIQTTLPTQVICKTLSRELTRFIIIKDKISNKPMMLIHTSDIDPSSMAMKMEHYHLSGTEDFIEVFKEDKQEAFTIPMDIINKIDSNIDDTNLIKKMVEVVYDLYDFMDQTSKAVTDFTPPIKIIGVGVEEENEGE